MNDDTDGERVVAESRPAAERLADMASEDGRSEEAVLEQLVAASWLLDELLGVLDRTGEFERGDRAGDAEAGAAGGRDAGTDSGGVSDLEAAVAALRTRVDAMEARSLFGGPDDAARDDRLAELSARLDAVTADTAARQDAAAAHVEGELEKSLVVFEYLVDAVDALDGRLDAFEAEMRERRARRVDADALAALRDRANVRGVATAACEACGAAVNVALLSAAACPSCGRTFADVAPPTGWFGRGRATLTTASTDRDDSVRRGVLPELERTD